MAIKDINNSIKRTIKVVTFCLLPGVGLFFTDQILLYIFDNEYLPLFSSVLYVIPFFVLSLFAIILVALLKKMYGREKNLKIFFIAGVSAAVLTFLLSVGGVVLGTTLTGPAMSAFFLEVVCIGYMIAGYFLSLSKRLSGVRLYGLLLISSVVFIVWSVIMPEWLFTQGTYPSVLLLIILIGIIYALFNLSFRPFFTAVTVLFFLIIAIASLNHLKLSSVCGVNDDVQASSGKDFSEKLNIILIVWDTVRRDHLSVYGFDLNTTPYLEKRSAENTTIIYDEVTSVASWTLPAHASMFTGLYPRSHGAQRFYNEGMDKQSKDYYDLNSEFKTLAERLSEGGYRCGGISANFSLAGRDVNMDQGFQYFCDMENPFYLKSGYIELPKKIKEALKEKRPASLNFPFFVPCMTADQVNKQSLKWLDKIKGVQPFFLFVNYMDAHYPYYAPPELRGLFDGYDPDLSYVHPFEMIYHLPPKGCALTENEKAHLASQYHSCIYYLDMKLREFEQGLKERGLFDDTVIILVADHGESLGEHNTIFHQFNHYSEVLGVPLIVKYPARKKISDVKAIFENRAVFELILDQAGMSVEPLVPEVPWKSLAEQKFSRSRKCFNTSMQRAVYFDEYKYMISRPGEDELYNLSQDPHELNNIAADEENVRKRGEKLLNEYENTIPQATPESPDRKFNSRQEEKLRTLGYIH